MTEVRVEGLGELLKTLEALPREIVSQRGGPVRSGLRKAALVLRDQARANIDRIVSEPNEGPTYTPTDTLKNALIVTRDPRPQRAGISKGERFLLRVRRRDAYPDGTKANLVGGVLEFGSEKMQAKPWLRPVLPQKGQEAIRVFIQETRKAIDRAVKRARRK